VQASEAEEYTQALSQIFGGGWRLILHADRQGIPSALGMSLGDWVRDRLGGYVRMSIEERRQVVAELTDGEGLSNRQAAEVVGVDEITIRRDRNDATNVADRHAEQIELNTADATNVAPTEPETPPLPEGRFRCIVIDPPWPVEKIERDVRPNQGQFLDYHVWSLQDIRDRVGKYLKEKADPTGCHIYLWITHRHLPEGFKFFSHDAWRVRYQCLMTWKKNVGITPYSWMYDTEHILFGRIGGLPLSENGLRLWFDAAVTRHSEKPGIFYDRVRAASPEPRLDLFAREHREGFTPWGDEVDRFANATT
jgi:N6-adenosine-specific RNA methylase IME4